MSGLFSGGLFFLVSAAWIVTAVASLVTAIVALASHSSREPILRRHPVGTVSWVLVLPFVIALVAALIMMGGGIADGQWGVALWASVPALALVLCGVVGVWCTRASKGRVRTGPWLPAAAGFGVPALCVIAFTVVEGFSLEFSGVALAVALVCGANGLLAMWINDFRKAGPPAATL